MTHLTSEDLHSLPFIMILNHRKMQEPRKRNRCRVSEGSLSARQEQKSSTHHSFLPDDAHAILNAWKPVGDLREVILAHGPLLDGECTVVGPHNVQSVTAAKQERDGRSHVLLPAALTSRHI